MSEANLKASAAAIRVATIAFRQFSPKLHAYLVGRIHRNSDVPDLAMEVFERFLRVKNMDAVENPRAYLFRIASHVVGDALRLESRSPVTYDSEAVDTAAETLQCGAPDVAERVSSERELEELYRAIEQLPDMQQAVLLLAVRDGLSHKEVAKRTGLGLKTVGVYVCEARARLRTILDRR